MNITMLSTRKITIQQIKEFLEGTITLEFFSTNKAETYQWMEDIFRELNYKKLKKPDKGLVRKYINKVTGYHKNQITNLINQYLTYAKLEVRKYKRNSFVKKFNDHDIQLLANIDDAHNCLAGPATRKIINRECTVFDKKEYQNLMQISVSHL